MNFRKYFILVFVVSAGFLGAAEADALREKRVKLSRDAMAAIDAKKFKQAIELLEQCNAIQRQLKEETHPATAMHHLQLGVARQRLNQLRLATEEHERSLKIARDCLEKKIRVPAGILTANWMALARIHSNLGQYAKAAVFLEQHRQLKLKVGNQRPAARLTTNARLADLYFELRQYQKSLTLLADDLELLHKLHPAQSLNRSRHYLRIADNLLRLGRHDEAEKIHQRATLPLRNAAEAGPLHIHALNQQADLLQARGREKTVPELLAFALKLTGKVHGAQSNAYAEQLIRQGRYHMGRGQLAAAKTNYIAAIGITRKQVKHLHPRTAQMLADHANLQFQLGNTTGAIGQLRQAIDIYGKTVGRDSPSLCAPLQQLGLIHTQQGNYPAAQSHLTRAVALSEKGLGAEHVETALLLASLGHLKLAMLDLPAAGQLLDRSLKLHLKWYGPGHRQTLSVRGERALLFEITKEPARAKAEYEQIHKAHVKNNTTESLSALRNGMRLARTLDQLGDDRAAGRQFAEILARAKQTLGDKHRQTAVLLTHQARHQARHGSTKEALAHQRTAIDLMRQLKLETDPFYIASLGNLAEFQMAERQKKGAIKTLSMMFAHQQQLYRGILGKLTEPDALTILQGQQLLTAQIHITIAAAPTQIAALRLGAAHLAFSKARLEEIRWAQSRVHNQSDAVLQTQREHVASLHAQLKRLTQKPEAMPPAVLLQKQADLAAKLQQAEAMLAKLIIKNDQAVARHLTDTGLTLGQIAGQLPARSVLIDLIAWRHPAQGKVKAHKRYTAYLTLASDPKAPRVSRVDLGPAAPIDAAITALHEQMYRRLVAPNQLGPVIAKLSRLLGEPLAKAVGPVKHFFICPDSHLARLPFELLKSKDKYWVNQYQISYLGSGRELMRLRQAKPKAAGNPAVVLGPPAFSAGEGAADQRQRPFKPLEFSAKETGIIAAALGKDTVRLAGKDATEAALRKVRQPRVLHLSTHAFYLHEPYELPSKRELLDAAPIELQPVRTNPLLQCGLALAGANDEKTEPDDATRDGLFTGLDAAQLDLHGTELVILSACESGVGIIHSGEGTMSLRRAFRVAGAEAVLASHWPVSDRATGELMRRFIGHWQKGKPRAEAFRAAQRELAADEDLGSPYFWAAFTLMGQWR